MRKWLRSLWIRAIARVVQGLLKMVLRTCRVDYVGIDNFLAVAQKQACVLMLWHEHLALVAPLLSRHPEAVKLAYAAFISASRDGLLLNELCARYPNCRILSVAHDRRHHALRAMIHQLQTRSEVLLITPDGPRGPPHRVKPGLAIAARKADSPVFPLRWTASREWRLNTWDRMRFPKPFSRIVVHFGPPAKMTGEKDDRRLEETLLGLPL